MKAISKKQWIKFAIATLLYLLWVYWLSNPWLVIGELLIVDIYLTEFIPFGFWKKSKNAMFKKVMEWVDAIVFALVAVYFINTFFFQNYQIPTSSLEKTLLVGDYLFVSKLSYGPRVPNTPLSFPLAQHTLPVLNCKSYIDYPQWEYKRVKGLGTVKRNDIVVFNFPAGDTVALGYQNTDYYTLCKAYGERKVKTDRANFGEIVYRPVDRRENYVKRCVGLPGDSLQIINGEIYINGKLQEAPKHVQFNYYVETNGKHLSDDDFRALGVSVEDREQVANVPYPVYRMPLTRTAVEKLRSFSYIKRVMLESSSSTDFVYPLNAKTGWTCDNYGPIWLPRRGATIPLSLANLPIYERVIRNYERNSLEVRDSSIFINGSKAETYTFKMGYYWMMGDNRHNSADSRSWGFVPEDHIVGKPIMVWLSLDKDRNWFGGKIRFKRLFHFVDYLSEN